jgi:hypothetical protein
MHLLKNARSSNAVAEPATPLMKSRGRIAFLKAQDCVDFRVHLVDYSRDLRPEKGFRGQFARHQSCPAHVRLGSKADIPTCSADVRLHPRKRTLLGELPRADISQESDCIGKSDVRDLAKVEKNSRKQIEKNSLWKKSRHAKSKKFIR